MNLDLDEYADQTELERALAALQAEDLVRLGRIARARCAGLVDFDASDLLHEAIARALGGRRRWPRAIALVAFLAQTMRSIASEGQKRSALFATGGDYFQSNELVDEQPLADRHMQAHEQVEAVLAEFANDELVLLLIDGLSRDETPALIMARCGLDTKVYDAARKRLSRGVDRMIRDQKL